MATAVNTAGTESGNQVVGKVSILYGNVKAISTDGTERALSPNSLIFAYDRVITESDGMVSITIDDDAQTQIDIGRMSDVVIDEDIFAGVSAEDAADAAAEVEQIQEALLAETFDPTVELEAAAAGESPATGGGHPVPDFARVTYEGAVTSGAETTGIAFDTVDPIDGVVEPLTPTISVEIKAEGGAAEEGTPVTFEVSINTVSDADTTVTVNVFSDQGDTATAHVDYDASDAPGVETYTVVIPAGETSATFKVDTYEDSLSEGSETFSAQIIDATNTNAIINVDPASATGLILDNDATPDVSISDGTPNPAVEGTDPSISFTVTLSNASDVPVTVQYGTQDGTATAGEDYTTQSGTITFNPGDPLTQTITVPVLNDGIFEGGTDETFTVGLANPTVATIADGSGDGAIDDTPDTPTVSISDGVPNPATEGVDANIEFTVTLSNASDVPVTVQYGTQDGTATAGEDYTTQSGTITFNPGDPLTQTITVPVLNDGIFEGGTDETFTVGLANPTVATIADGSGDGAIDDTPDTPTVSISDGVPNPATEGVDANIEFTVTLSNASDVPVTVQYGTQDGTATAGEDYTTQSGTITFNPGDPLTQTITVPVLNDGIFEGGTDETFTVGLANPTVATIADGSGDGAIDDTPDTPTVSISDGVPNPATEGVDANIEFTVTLSNASDVPVTVEYGTQNGTATAGEDYTTQSGTLTFNPGDPLTQTITVPVLNDGIFEGGTDETFTVGLANPTVATIADGSGDGAIDDTPDTPTVSISDGVPNPATEGVDANIEFTVTLSNASDVPVTVQYGTQDGTATAGEDYTTQSGTITFNPGDPLTQTITVPVLNDGIFEGGTDETFTVGLANPTVATIADGSGDGAIDDTPDTPTVSISDGVPNPATEGVDANIEFTVTLSNASDVPVTVQYGTQDGTATAGEDYTTQSGTITFNPGDPLTQTITVPVLNDGIFEGGTDETFTVGLANPTVATIADGSGDGAIDDTPDTPTVSISDGVPNPATEGVDANIEFTVTLSNASDVPVTVQYGTQDGTATAGEDYTTQSGTITFNPGDPLTQTITVPVLNDGIFEGGTDETFTVGLANPTVATIADGSGDGAIDDTPDTPTVSISDGVPNPATEGVDANIEFTVTLSNASDVPVTVQYGTQDGTATAGEDYTTQSGTITFNPGDPLTQTITVPVLNDGIFEGGTDETFTVGLANPTVATIADGSGDGAIDDTPDTPTVSISDGVPNPATEGVDANIEFTVTLSNASDVPVTVQYGTQDGTATAGEDYTTQSGTITFNPGDPLTQTITVPVLNDGIFEGGTDETFTVGLANPTVATIADGSGDGAIDDTPDTPTVSISDGVPNPATEGVDANIEFTVTLSNASDVPVTVQYGTQDGTATAGEDYTTQSGTITFNPGDPLTQTITVPVLNDGIFEGGTDETFTVGLANPTVATIADGSGDGAIDDTPDTPAVSISDGVPNPATEGVDANIEFTVTLSNASDVPVTVQYGTQDGTATAGEDYTTQSGTITFNPGDPLTQTITVPVLNDGIFEGGTDETFTVGLANPTVATIADGSGDGAIDDTPDTPTVSISDGVPNPATEGVDANIEFTVTLSNASDVPVTVQYGTQDGTATAGEDYTTQSGTITFNPGDPLTQTITVPVLNDGIFEGGTDETFTVGLANPTVATIADGSGDGAIDDTPDTPTVSISDGVPNPATEGVDANIEFTVTLSNASDVPVTVQYGTQDGTATAGEDYTTQSGTITFNPGDPLTQTITVPVLNDGIFEGGTDETFTVGLANPTVATIADGSGDGAIDDTPDTPTVSISDGVPNPATEGVDANIEFTVTLSNASDVPVTVQYGTQDGTATAGEDYTTQSGTITFNPGDPLTQTITVPVLNDGIFEGGTDETFTVGLANPTVATIADGSGDGAIDDTPDTPTVSISDGNPDPAVEGTDPSISFTVTLSNASDVPVTVEYGTQNGTATAGEDYTTQSGTLTFNPGDPLTQTITVPVVDNNTYEGDESFTVELSNPTVATIDDGSGLGNIDDTPDTPTVSISDGTPDPAVEGTDPSISFTVTLSNASDVPVTVEYGTQDGTATAGEDYTTQSGTLTFNPGDPLTQTITVPVVDNNTYEGDESFTVELSNPTVATIDDGSGLGNIDDTPDTPTVSISDGTPNPAVEGEDPTITFTVTLSNASDVPVTVEYGTQNGTATAGEDYTTQSGTLTFNPGDPLTQTITVPVVDNNTYEGDESFTVELSNPTVATIDDGSGLGNIDDTPDTPTVSISDGTPDPAVEGTDPSISFTVTLSNASDVPVTVEYGTQNGTATAGEDYTTQSGTLTFNPGDPLTQTITVPVVDNNTYEGDESFTVELSNPTVATIDDGSGLGNIDDTPDTPTVSISDGTPDPAVEGTDPSISFTVTLSNASDVPVTVEYGTQNGTATAGEDYTTQSGTLTFNPGDPLTQTITVPVVDNNTYEGDESFTVELSNPTVATIDDGSGLGNIDDTPDTPTVSISDGTPDPAVEGTDPSISFTVTLSNASDVPVTVEYGTQNGTATAGEDYTTQSGTLTFNPGDPLTQTITVPVLNDNIFEGDTDESFTVDLSNPTVATIDDGSGDGNIIDNDHTPEVGTSTATISEEGLPYGNKDGEGTPTDTTNSDTFTGNISVIDADGDSLTVTLEDPPADGAFKSGDVDITWSPGGTNTLIGTAGADTIITISIDNLGNYTVVLDGPIDHPTVGVEDVTSFDVTVRASDGFQSSTNTLTVNIEDDSPTIVADYDAIIANEQGNSLTAELDIDFGADGAATVTGIQLTGPTAVDGTGDPTEYVTTNTTGDFLTSNGVKLVYQDNGNGTLTAVTADTEATPIFTVAIDPVTQSYTVTINGLLDGAAGTYVDLTTGGVSGGNDMFIDFYSGVDTDENGQGDIKIHVTGLDENGAPGTVNSSIPGMGVNNNWVDNLEAKGKGDDPDSEQMILQFSDTTPDPADPNDPEYNPTYDLISADITVNSLDANELVFWSVYNTNGSTDPTTWGDPVHNGFASGSGDTNTTFSIDRGVDPGTGEPLTFDAIILTASDGSEYRVLNITTYGIDDGTDHEITYLAEVTDGDGDTASDTFDVFFDADGNIAGTDANEVISGSSGDDIIHGGGGDDIVFAGGGDDTIFVNDGDTDPNHIDIVSGGEGIDETFADSIDSLLGDVEIEHT